MPRKHNRGETAGTAALGGVCCLSAAAAARGIAAMVARHVAEPRQLGGAAPLLPALDHYHRTDEVQPRRGADKQRRQTDRGEEDET